MLLSALQHIFAGLKRTRDQKLSSGLKSGQLNLSSLFQRRGTCAVECVAAHLRGSEEDSRSEVVFWIEEWSIEFVFIVSTSRNMCC